MGLSGGMGLWWNDLNVIIRSFSAHHIAADICDENDVVVWCAVGVYGWAKVAHKCHTWALMRQLGANTNLPTVYFGDFNEITGLHEKIWWSNSRGTRHGCV